MFEKNMKYSYLLDVYGNLLDDHSAAIMRAYYEDDLSLSEIADGEDISRQGVRHIIKKSEEQLDHLEQRLKLTDHYAELAQLAEQILDLSLGLESGNTSREGAAAAMRIIANKLSDK